MGLKEIMEKYGEPDFYKGNWFTLSDGMIRIPPDLSGYVAIQDGKIIELKNIPEELQDRVKALVEAYRKAQDPEDLTEYRRGIEDAKSNQ